MSQDVGAAFEFTMSLPPDRRFAPMLRDLAAQGARQAGLSDDDAAAFGLRVESAAGDALSAEPRATSVAVIVRYAGGPVEITIGSCYVSITR
jgi:hypothetical protein